LNRVSGIRFALIFALEEMYQIELCDKFTRMTLDEYREWLKRK
jgi:hypothetical protein